MAAMDAFPMAEFSATSRYERGRPVVRMDGELDIASEGLARAEIEIALSRGAGDLVVDVEGLTFLDVRGVHVLLDAREACLPAGRRMLVLPAPARVWQIVVLCGVGDRFDLLRPAFLAV